MTNIAELFSLQYIPDTWLSRIDRATHIDNIKVICIFWKMKIWKLSLVMINLDLLQERILQQFYEELVADGLYRPDHGNAFLLHEWRHDYHQDIQPTKDWHVFSQLLARDGSAVTMNRNHLFWLIFVIC